MLNPPPMIPTTSRRINHHDIATVKTPQLDPAAATVLAQPLQFQTVTTAHGGRVDITAPDTRLARAHRRGRALDHDRGRALDRDPNHDPHPVVMHHVLVTVRRIVRRIETAGTRDLVPAPVHDLRRLGPRADHEEGAVEGEAGGLEGGHFAEGEGTKMESRRMLTL